MALNDEIYQADQAEISFKPEPSFGTTPGSIDWFFGSRSLDIGTTVENQVVMSSDGTREPQTVIYSQQESGGSIPGDVFNGRPLMWMLGQPSTTSLDTSQSGVDNEYEHTFASRHESLSFAIQVAMRGNSSLPNLDRHVLGCVAENIEIDVPAGSGKIEYSISYTAKEDLDSSDGITVSAVESYDGLDPLKADYVHYEAEGTKRTDIEDATIRLESTDQNTRYSSKDTDDSHKPHIITQGGINYVIDLTVAFQDKYWRDKLRNREKISSFKVLLDVGGKGGRYDTWELTFSGVTVEDAPMDIPEDGDLEDTVTLNADSLTAVIKDDFQYQ